MNSKILACAALVTAAVLSAWGCSSMQTTGKPSSIHDCTKNTNDCSVSLRYHVPGSIDGPDVIQINAGPNDKVSITWDLSSLLGARFSPTGITAEAPFTCNQVSDKVFTCTAIGLQHKEYKYTVTLVGGILYPWPWDPWIKN